MIPINANSSSDQSRAIYVAVSVFLLWLFTNSVAVAIRGTEFTITAITAGIVAQALIGGGVAAATVVLISDYQREWLTSIWKPAVGVAVVMVVFTALANVTKDATLIEHGVAIVSNSLGTGVGTAIGLSLYRGRSSASLIGLNSGGSADA